ncbi:hypothetical protein ACOSQ3_006859 [Xanthoceras sorbifolium]
MASPSKWSGFGVTKGKLKIGEGDITILERTNGPAMKLCEQLKCGRNKYGERVTKRYNEYAGYVNKVNYGFNNHGGNPSHNGQVEKISSGFEYGKSSLVKDNSLNNRGVRGISGVNNQEGTSRGGSSRFEILEDVMEESEGATSRCFGLHRCSKT